MIDPSGFSPPAPCGWRGSDGSGCWSSCRARASGSVRLSSSGMIRWASTLPSSTPHWSNESMSQIDALREDAVLVERDQLAEQSRA